MIRKVNLAEAFATFDETWSPRVAGDVNETQIKLAKLEGSFEWHHHETEDELFLVVNGRLRIALRDQDDLVLEAGEFAIVPRGVDHRPVAESACEVVLVEPRSTINTGNLDSERTVSLPKRLD